MTDLSSAAQVVLNAAGRRYAIDGDLQESLAAALRAAAYANIPPVGRTPWLSGYFNETFENYQSYGEYLVCESILSIAAELEGNND
jgi:hypothetical protein